MLKLELKNIEKIYPNGYKAIKNIDLEVNSGEFIVFVGPSGCGKSTLLRMIAGLENITSGDLYLNGKKINNIEPADRDIAMVFQNYALYPHMTVYNNMAYGLKNRGYKKDDIELRIKEAAEILEISPYLANKPSQLSGGQRQRVAMGRAIVRHPELFLFDEPLSNLDAKLRTQTRVELKKLHNRLTATTIYVTHDQVEAMTMADKIVILNNGEIEQFGTPSKLYNHPNSVFVAGFLGSPSMNFISPKLLSYSPEIANVAGIRPEHLHIDIKESRDCQLIVMVELIEDLGADCLIHTRAENGDVILVRASPKRISGIVINKQLTLYFKKEYTHFFDREGQVL